MQDNEPILLSNVVWGGFVLGIIVGLIWIGRDNSRHFKEIELREKVYRWRSVVGTQQYRIRRDDRELEQLEKKLRASQFVDFDELYDLAGILNQLDSLETQYKRVRREEKEFRLLTTDHSKVHLELLEIITRNHAIRDDIETVKRLRLIRETNREQKSGLSHLEFNLREAEDELESFLR